MARDLQQKFNRIYCTPGEPLFPRPEPLLPDTTASRLRSLRNPEKKMSKSDPDTKSCIYLTDSPDSIAAKVRACVTDSTKELVYDPESRPGVANLIVILSELEGRSPEVVTKELQEQGRTKVELKELVTAALVDTLVPIQKDISRILEESGHLESVLEEGRDAARAIAVQTMNEVRRLIGFR